MLNLNCDKNSLSREPGRDGKMLSDLGGSRMATLGLSAISEMGKK